MCPRSLLTPQSLKTFPKSPSLHESQCVLDVSDSKALGKDDAHKSGDSADGDAEKSWGCSCCGEVGDQKAWEKLEEKLTDVDVWQKNNLGLLLVLMLMLSFEIHYQRSQQRLPSQEWNPWKAISSSLSAAGVPMQGGKRTCFSSGHGQDTSGFTLRWNQLLPLWWEGRCLSPCQSPETPRRRARASQRRASRSCRSPQRRWGGGRVGWRAPSRQRPDQSWEARACHRQ